MNQNYSPDLIYRLKANHIYNAPIESMKLLRRPNGDTLLLAANFKEYDIFDVKENYSIETDRELTYSSQFIPAYYTTQINKDANYKLQQSVVYNSNSFPIDLVDKSGKKSIIWDEAYNVPLASVNETNSSSIAYSSFETSAKGNWIFSGLPVIDPSAPTGRKVYDLQTGSVSTISLPSNTYTVSYWSKNGAQSVNSTSATAGRSLNGYTLYEHKVTLSSGLITISGTGKIDELRLYPSNSQMTSYTYKSIIGLSTICAANNSIVYYEYDAKSRLTLIRDQDQNIIKRICYNYAGQIEDCSQKVVVKIKNATSTPFNLNLTNSSTSVSYPFSVYPNAQEITLGTLPAGQYSGSINPMYPPGASTVLKYYDVSQTANSFTIPTRQLKDDILFTLESPPAPSCSFSMLSGYSSPTNGINSSGSTVSFYMAFYATSTMYAGNTYTIANITGCRPSTTRTVSFSSGGRSCTFTFYSSGYVGFSFTGSSISAYTTVTGTSLSYQI